MRKRVAFWNLTTSILFQIINLLSGILIPRYIIFHYGSEVNGLMNSITQFLNYISLTEAGLYSIIFTAFYKAFASEDNKEISTIAKTSKRFFSNIGIAFLIYVLLLVIIYPCFVQNNFDRLFTSSLLIIISLSTIARYFLGWSYRILIQSDQKLYYTNIIESCIVFINAIAVILLIKLGATVHVAKLMSVLIYSIPSLIYYLYVKKHYKLIKDCETDKNLIKDRWSAFGHHIAACIHFNTDPIVLTLFSNVKEVSVYSIYAMIVSGIRGLVANLPNSLSATFGNMIAKGEDFKDKYESFDYLNLIVTAIFYTATSILMVPFVNVYTNGITDVNYIRPYFAILIIFAEFLYSIQTSYTMIVFAAGHFKQTKRDSYIEAFINVFVSILMVKNYGLSGVALGTICAIFWRMITYAIYLSKNIVCWELKDLFKRYLITFLGCLASYILIKEFITFSVSGYISWIIYAMVTTFITSVIIITISLILNSKEIKNIYEIFFKEIIRKVFRVQSNNT